MHVIVGIQFTKTWDKVPPNRKMWLIDDSLSIFNPSGNVECSFSDFHIWGSPSTNPTGLYMYTRALGWNWFHFTLFWILFTIGFYRKTFTQLFSRALFTTWIIQSHLELLHHYFLDCIATFFLFFFRCFKNLKNYQMNTILLKKKVLIIAQHLQNISTWH